MLLPRIAGCLGARLLQLVFVTNMRLFTTSYCRCCRGLPSASNAGCLGARLSRLVCGPQLSFVLVSNFMVDMGWLLSACPDIATADRVRGDAFGGLFYLTGQGIC
jgi:hypothetical protein